MIRDKTFYFHKFGNSYLNLRGFIDNNKNDVSIL